MPHARLHEYARGGAIYAQETPAERCLVLLSGWVKLFRLRHNGDEAVIRVQKQGDTFGINEGLRGETYRHHASAITQCTVLAFPSRILRDTLAGDPEFGKVLLMHSFEVTDNLHDQIEALKSRKAIERLALFLRDLAEPGKSRMTFSLPFDKATLAGYLGMQPESLSRALAQLSGHGVRVSKDQIEITDRDALEALLQDADDSLGRA